MVAQKMGQPGSSPLHDNHNFPSAAVPGEAGSAEPHRTTARKDTTQPPNHRGRERCDREPPVDRHCVVPVDLDNAVPRGDAGFRERSTPGTARHCPRREHLESAEPGVLHLGVPADGDAAVFP